MKSKNWQHPEEVIKEIKGCHIGASPNKVAILLGLERYKQFQMDLLAKLKSGEDEDELRRRREEEEARRRAEELRLQQLREAELERARRLEEERLRMEKMEEERRRKRRALEEQER